ncbi:MAG: hypothetical protein LBQ56_03240, partial [Synergistaceae bacterium]|nr:hypothetical protein [Synergistaceae bacterium]
MIARLAAAVIFFLPVGDALGLQSYLPEEDEGRAVQWSGAFRSAYSMHSRCGCNEAVKSTFLYFSIVRVRLTCDSLTRFSRLKGLEVSEDQAWQWANTRKGYWRISGSW